jgi:hypothetical protein
MTIRASEACLPWMEAHGVRFQPSLSGTLSLSRTNAFFLGGGKALVNAYYNTAEDLRVTVAYDAEVTHIAIEDGRFTGLDRHHRRPTAADRGARARARLGRVPGGSRLAGRRLGAGGRAELPDPRHALQPRRRAARHARPGRRSVGDPTQCHAVAIDGRAPKFDGGIVTRLDCVPFSIVVNRDGERFYDEGEDVWPKRYAIWGRLVAPARPGRLFDHRFEVDQRLSCPRSSRPRRPTPSKGWARSSASRRSSRRRSRRSTPPAAPAPSTRPNSTVCDRGADAAQDQLGAAHRRAALLRLLAAARGHLHLSRAEGGRDRPRLDPRDGSPMSGRRARSWRARSWAKATLPASA